MQTKSYLAIELAFPEGDDNTRLAATVVSVSIGIKLHAAMITGLQRGNIL